MFHGPLSPSSDGLPLRPLAKTASAILFRESRKKAIRQSRTVHTAEGTLDDRARETIARHTPAFVSLCVPSIICPASRAHDSLRRWFRLIEGSLWSSSEQNIHHEKEKKDISQQQRHQHVGRQRAAVEGGQAHLHAISQGRPPVQVLLLW